MFCGLRWSIIAQQLPGRTDNDVKNYWNTKLRKKLSEMGIDPVTHKPFSQILADYGNIGGIPKSRTRIGSLNRDMKHTFSIKAEPYPFPSAAAEGFSNNQLMTTMASPGVHEPIQDNNFFPNNSSINHHADQNDPLDLLSQLQAIKLVTEASNYNIIGYQNISSHQIPNNQYSLSSSSSSSSSSTSSSTCSTTAALEKSDLAFSWRDFLLEDAFLPSDNHPQGQEDQILEFSSNFVPQSKCSNETNAAEHEMPITNGFQASSSSADSSFVEAMLDQENEMFSEFANLLEDPSY